MKFKDDPETREDIIQDHSFLWQKIYISNIVKILKLVVQMLFIAFYVGVYFVIFSQTIHEFQFVELPEGEEVHHDEESYVYDTFVENGNWSIVDESSLRRVLIALYFAFTTLSTTGLGDYYPVSDIERLVGAFILLIGVAIFSYIMGELLTMLIKF